MRRIGEVISVRPVFDAGAAVDGVLAIRIVSETGDVELEFDARSCALLYLGIGSYLKPFQSATLDGTLSNAPLIPIA
jgi:hypothetical protein